jgi:CRISPR system Cascade subunit CasE
MFLSRIPVNVMSRAFRRDHADVHQMHRTLMSAFPDVADVQGARQHHGVLWRLDGSGNNRALLVQSCEHPDWSKLPEGYVSARVQVKSLKPVLTAIQPGRRLAFLLVANPTQSKAPVDGKPGDRRRGTRTPINHPEQQVQWLIRQGERHGYVIPAANNGSPDVTASPLPPFIGRKPDNRVEAQREDRLKITVQPVSYEGHLIIADPDTFTAALKEGIGRAKAYGCGLISVAPTRRTRH